MTGFTRLTNGLATIIGVVFMLAAAPFAGAAVALVMIALAFLDDGGTVPPGPDHPTRPAKDAQP